MASDRSSLPSELNDFLSKYVSDLQNDFTSGAREMADQSLSNLKSAIEIASKNAETEEQLWDMAVCTAKGLASARPKMSAAITSTLLRALSKIHTNWQNIHPSPSPSSISTLAHLATDTILSHLDHRASSSNQLSQNFISWILQNHHPPHPNSSEARIPIPDAKPLPLPLKILTLSNSSTIRAALLTLLTQIPSPLNLTLTLTILESRPNFEGADLAADLLSSLPLSLQPHSHSPKLTITIAPDCAVASVIKDKDVLLLGADAISAEAGDVSNKIGSLAAAVCARFVGKEKKKTVVVVLSEVDKIVADTTAATPSTDGEEGGDGEGEIHGLEELSAAWGEETRGILCGEDGDKVDGFGEWFEWVPNELVDVFITDRGVLGKEEVAALGQEIGELEKLIFGKA